MKIQLILNLLDRIGARFETILLVFILVSMILIAVGQIIMREVFEVGFVWIDELVRLMVLWIALVGSIAACRENRHIRIEIISNYLSDRVTKLIQAFVDMFAAIICGFIAFQSWRYLKIEIEYSDTVLVDTPAWIAHSIIPAAFFLISFRFLITSLKKTIVVFFGKQST